MKSILVWLIPKFTDGFYTYNVEVCPDDVKYKQKAKFLDTFSLVCDSNWWDFQTEYKTN